MIRSKKPLIHYGVKGMKWGVRRTKEELKYNSSSIHASSNRSIRKFEHIIQTGVGMPIRAISIHASSQASERKVSSKDIVDALKNPLYTDGKIRIDSGGRKSVRYIGKNAVVNINPDNGVITTVWRTSSKLKDRYGKEE